MKWAKRIAIALLALVVLMFLFAQFFLNGYLEKVVQKRLNSIIVKGSGGLYKYELGNLDISFWTGKLEVENLHIMVDSVRYKERQKEKSLPQLTFDLKLLKGKITGVKVLPLIFSRKIRIGSIVPENTELTLSRHYTGAREPMEGGIKDEPLWMAIKPDIESIRVGKFVLDSLRLYYSNVDSAKAFNWQFQNCSAVLDDIKIDSTADKDSNRILFTKDIAIIFNDIKLKTVDSFYQISAKKVVFSSEKKALDLQQFSMIPAVDRDTFYARLGKQEDMFNINMKELKCDGFQLYKFVTDDEVRADSILVNEPQIGIYFDRTLVQVPENKLGKYPPQLLLNAGMAIRVNKLHLNNGSITYTELADKNLKEGSLSFTELNAFINNITNHSEDIRKNPVCVADVTTKFMKQSPLTARFTFYLDSTNGSFAIEGKLNNLSAQQISPVTVALAKAQLNSLQLHELTFTVNGNEQLARGTVRMLYNGLSLTMLKKDDNGTLKTSKFITKMLNKLTFRSDNPMNGEPEKVARDILYVRDPFKSFFSIVWRTVFAGMQVVSMNIKGLTS